MHFDFAATNKAGKVVRGSMEAETREKVVAALRQQGFVPVSVSRPNTLRERIGQMTRQLRGGVSHLEKTIFTKHLSLMLRAGLTLAEALDILIEQARNGRFRGIVAKLRETVTMGESFTDALNYFPNVFPGYYVSVVAAGEMSGTLEGNLTYLSEQMNKEHDLRKRVKSALLYPTIVISAALVIGYFFSIFVIPQVAELFRGLKGVKLPWYTDVMLTIANFTKNHSISAFVGLFGGLWFMIWFLRRKFLAPVTHWALLRLPIVGKIVKDLNVARYTMVMATMLQAGIDIITATNVTVKVVGNYYYQSALKDVAVKLQTGRPMSESLADYADLFPPVVTRMVSVGERTGKLQEVLQYLTEFYQLEVESTLKNLATILEPVLLLVIGVIALGLAMSILMPIYNYISSIRMI